MAQPLQERKRYNEVADELVALKDQGQSAITQLNAVKGNILSLKQAVVAEAVFGAEEEAEVGAVIADLAQQIKAIVGA